MPEKRWVALSTLASPVSGTFFTKIRTEHNHKYVIWYKGNYWLQPGDVISISGSILYIGGRVLQVNIIEIDRYIPTIWRVMSKISSCTGGKEPGSSYCSSRLKCIFKICPYHKIRTV